MNRLFKIRPRSLLVSNERGQVLVIGLIVAVGLVMIAITVANVGIMVAEKIHVQDTVDAAAYSAAVVEARYMNLSAYVNRAMVANYNSMAFNTAVWAVIDADDHGIAVVTDILYKISAILFVFPLTTAFAQPVDQVADVFRDYIHYPLHFLNHYLNEIFAQDDDAQDLNQYIETYNIDVLTMYQGFLYAALQSARYQVAQEVAQKMDPAVSTTSVLGLGAEAVSYDELARAVDFVIRDVDARDDFVGSFNKPFNEMMGEAANTDDHPLLLSAVTEASLDKFAAGRDREGNPDLLRQFNVGNILPATDAIETILDIECYAECAAECTLTLGISCDCDCDAEFNLTLGAEMRDGQENKASEDHVPFIARQRMREVNFFGINLRVEQARGFYATILNTFVGAQGHTSGDIKNDVYNFANASPGLNYLDDLDFNRAAQCIAAGCFPYTRGLNYLNYLAAITMFPPINVPILPFTDDHWDGTFEDNEPVNTWEIYDPAQGKVEGGEYVVNVLAEGFEYGVPKYDWQVDLDNVGFPHYIYPKDGAAERLAGNSGGSNNNFLTGPSVAVVGIKKLEDLRGIEGLGIGNDYPITAIARAQVYYLRNPNRPEEKPSLFNPHWAARLAPIESEDTPLLLRQGLPFIGSYGVPIQPTH